jgi:hypothetical protein
MVIKNKNMTKTQKQFGYSYKCKGFRQKANKKMWRDIAIMFVIYSAVLPSILAISGYYAHIKELANLGSYEIKVAKAQTIETPSVEDQIRAIAKEKNFKWPDYLVRLADCESKLNQYAININRDKTKDLGTFQINDVHKLSAEFRFDIRKSTEWTIDKINNGQQGIWVCDKLVK